MYWALDDWRKSTDAQRFGKTKAKSGDKTTEAVACLHLKDKDGVIPSDWKDITSAVRGIFRIFVDEGIAPASWNNGTLPTHRDRLKNELENRFHVFRLCHNGWKSHYIAVSLYPGFKATQRQQWRKSHPGKTLPGWLTGPKTNGTEEEDENEAEAGGDEPSMSQAPKRKEPSTSTGDAIDANASQKRPRRPRLKIVDPLYVSLLILICMRMLVVTYFYHTVQAFEPLPRLRQAMIPSQLWRHSLSRTQSLSPYHQQTPTPRHTLHLPISTLPLCLNLG